MLHSFVSGEDLCVVPHKLTPPPGNGGVVDAVEAAEACLRAVSLRDFEDESGSTSITRSPVLIAPPFWTQRAASAGVDTWQVRGPRLGENTPCGQRVHNG